MGKFLLDLTTTFGVFYERTRSLNVERRRTFKVLKSVYWYYVAIVLIALIGLIIPKKRNKLSFLPRDGYHPNSFAKARLQLGLSLW